MRLIALLIAPFVMSSSAAVIPEVRQAIAQGDFHRADQIVQTYRASGGITPELLEAMSWQGRGALAAKQYDQAEKYAAETYKLAEQRIKEHKLDSEPNVPIALGAAIEVQAQAMAARGERASAVSYLQRELKTYYTTSIRTRIQKNIHLLSLEGKTAPALDVKQWLGPKPAPLASYRGKPVLLFFWAHWCGDCRREVATLAKLKAEMPGLVFVGPTQHYGYVAHGEEAAAEQEFQYIEKIRNEFYKDLLDVPAPVSEENFKKYGASTTPTLVLIDKAGVVRMYHPGAMTYEELKARIQQVAAGSAQRAASS